MQKMGRYGRLQSETPAGRGTAQRNRQLSRTAQEKESTRKKCKSKVGYKGNQPVAGARHVSQAACSESNDAQEHLLGGLAAVDAELRRTGRAVVSRMRQRD